MAERNERRAEIRAAIVAAVLAASLAAIGFYITRLPPWKPSPFDYSLAMIPMRDGVKLETVIFTPKNAKARAILLGRTPYGVPSRDVELSPGLLADGYVRVFQNIRGRYKSEGKFVMMRPPRDRADPKATDEGTDAYDTIDWLVKNVPDNSGRVCIFGTSYDGWTSVMALLDPHPALRCASERASPNDMFVNDDFHHNGALRLTPTFEYSAMMEGEGNAKPDAKLEELLFPFARKDTYDFFLELGPLRHADERHFHGKLPTWEDVSKHPNRDAFWEEMAVTTHLTKTTVPVQHVVGWWDQEDLVGPLAIYAALEKSDVASLNYLVVGPWNHGGWHGEGTKLGPIDMGSDTAKEFREGAQRRWFAHWLKDEPLDLPEALVFETGANRWRKLDAWPPKSGVTPRRLYMHAEGKLSFDAPTETAFEGFDSYVSDPRNPVPYRHRPITPTWPDSDWPTWLVQDQRFVDHRPDVLTWQTDVLEHDVVIAGDVVAELYASTTGTDSDWVVKLIDVLPDGTPPNADAGVKPEDDLRGYELMITSEIFRARYRKSFALPEPVPANEVVKYGIDLHSRSHAFLRGHRIMVQVQSSWFPLYDRNPQKYVESIYAAEEADFVKATQRIVRSHDTPSSIVLPVVDDH